MSDCAIGVFDSGVGGLTVARSIMQRLPNHPIVYLGDTARVPYGTKSAMTVTRYASSAAHLLSDCGLSMLVVACNTVSAYALDSLRAELDIPVVGVVEPGAQQAVATTKNKRVGIVGTTGTVASGAYQRAIAALDEDVRVFCTPCPLFVPLAEEGWTQGSVPEEIAQTYLAPMEADNIDTLLLGCTHYPILHDVIAGALGPGVNVVDSANATATVVEQILEAQGDGPENDAPVHRFMVSDAPETFMRVGEAFLGHAIGEAEWVDF